MRKLHELKIQHQFWQSVNSGSKTCEVRFNDRDFQTGDEIKFIVLENNTLNVKFWDEDKYTITHVTNYPMGLNSGFVALSIKKSYEFKDNE